MTALQLPFGGIAWARNAYGGVADTALVAGSSSIHHALACGLALAELLDAPQPEWELAAGLGHALRAHEDLFDPKPRYSMDWYYPVLGGAVREADAPPGSPPAGTTSWSTGSASGAWTTTRG